MCGASEINRLAGQGERTTDLVRRIQRHAAGANGQGIIKCIDVQRLIDGYINAIQINACTADASGSIGIRVDDQAQRARLWLSCQTREIRGLTAKHIKAPTAEAQRVRRTQGEVGNIDEAGTLSEVDAPWRQPEQIGRRIQSD